MFAIEFDTLATERSGFGLKCIGLKCLIGKRLLLCKKHSYFVVSDEEEHICE